jgi:hypothetical protein
LPEAASSLSIPSTPELVTIPVPSSLPQQSRSRSPQALRVAFDATTLPSTTPPQDTFADLICYIDSRADWSEAIRGVRKAAVRRIGWSIVLIEARRSGEYLDPDRRKLDLSRIPFNIPAINRALKGMSYRLAGFNTDKSFRNAKSGLRRVGRELGRVAPFRGPELPPDSPFAPFVAMADHYGQEYARLFAARLHHKGRHPSQVTGADVLENAAFLETNKVGVKIDAVSRRIVRLWRETAAHHPDWPQTPLALPDGGRKPTSLPFSAYPASLQAEIDVVRCWMQGSDQRGPFGGQFHREPLRPATIKYRLKYIRLILSKLVEMGVDPRSITSLICLLVPETMQAILQSFWDDAQLRLLAIPESERDYNRTGNTGHTEAAGATLLMLATHCFPQPPGVLKKIGDLARAVRRPRQSEMSKKNRNRLDQFADPVKLGLLLRLPYTLMEEAKREPSPVVAARLARCAILIGTECRIPLRIGNLHACRLGHNLRFSSPYSELVTLGFQAYETKNWLEIEFYVGSRLRDLLKYYIDHFLPFFAAGSPDFAEKQWLFPSGNGREGPLSDQQVRKIIVDTVAERVGAIIHPHLFRGLAVKLCLDHSPGALEHCRQMLGDKTLTIVLRHYVRVMRKEAGEHHDKLVDAEEDRLREILVRVARNPPKGGRS